MAFCIQCGARIPDDAKFCSQCGSVQNPAPVVNPTPVLVTPAAQPVLDPYDPADDRVMLLSLGTCDAITAASLLQRTCGYTEADARLIAMSAPITLAQNLTAAQSAVLAQALAEYGMEVTVFDGTDYREVKPAYETVYNRTGGLLEQAAAILGLIGVGNRLARNMIRRQPYPFRFGGVRPPMMVVPRRYASARPTPKPVISRPAPRANQKLNHAIDNRRAPAVPVFGRGPAPAPAPAERKLNGAVTKKGLFGFGAAPAPAPAPRQPKGEEKLGGAIGTKKRW